MSGGSFNYAFGWVAQFVYELEDKISNSHCENEWGETPYKFNPEVISKLHGIKDLSRVTARMMKEVEWLYSGDTGEETFLKNVEDFGVFKK